MSIRTICGRCASTSGKDLKKSGKAQIPFRLENLAAPLGERTLLPHATLTSQHSVHACSSSIRVPAQSFGVQEKNWLAMRPDFWALRRQGRACLPASVVRARQQCRLPRNRDDGSRRPDVCPKISRSENSAAERLDQLDPAVRRTRRKPPSRHAPAGDWRAHLDAQRVPVDHARGRSIRNAMATWFKRPITDDGSSLPVHTSTTSTWTTGRLPQAAATAPRTAFSIAMETISASRRFGRGKLIEGLKQRVIDDLIDRGAVAGARWHPGRHHVRHPREIAFRGDRQGNGHDPGNREFLAHFHGFVARRNIGYCHPCRGARSAPRR